MFKEITEKEDIQKLAIIKENIKNIAKIYDRFFDKNFGSYADDITKVIEQIRAANRTFDVWYELIPAFNDAFEKFKTLSEKSKNNRSDPSSKVLKNFITEINSIFNETQIHLDYLKRKYEVKPGSEQETLIILIQTIKKTNLASNTKAVIRHYLEDHANIFKFISSLFIKVRNAEEAQFKVENENEFLRIEEIYKEGNLYLTEEINKINENSEKEGNHEEKTNREKRANLLIIKDQLVADKERNNKIFKDNAEILRKKLGLSGSIYGDNGCYRQIESVAGYTWHPYCWIREIFFTSSKISEEKSLLVEFYYKDNSFNEKFLDFIESQYSTPIERKISSFIPRSVINSFFSDFLPKFLEKKNPLRLNK